MKDGDMVKLLISIAYKCLFHQENMMKIRKTTAA